MQKSLKDEIYSDRSLNCAKCRKHLFDVRMDAQILVSPDGLILFGFVAYQCGSCGRNGRFLAPNLPDVVPTLDNQFPDTKQIENRAIGITKLKFDRYRVRVHGRYVGVYPDEKTAIKVRDVELAKDLNYKPKQQDAQKEIQENSAAT